jgi:outer membrane receptor for ferrienterochelin and colicins
MRSRWSAPAALQLALVVLAFALAPLSAAAQAPGRILGSVTTQDGAPITGAQVSVTGTRLGTLTGVDGQFVLTGVPAGMQQIRVTFLGFREVTSPVQVNAGEASTVNVRMDGQPVQLGGVVVSAARRAQRITEAPAAITTITPEVLDNAPGNTWASALKQVPGLDFIQTGMTTAAVNARGFNSSFNNRMLMMEDGRIAVLPENGLPVGSFTAIPKVDLAGIEVLVGPGAALYGADASSGVVNLQTKDPRRFPGTTVEITGGQRGGDGSLARDSRNYFNVQARQAGVRGNLGYKVAAEYQDADEWENVLTYNIAGVPNRGTVAVRETDLGANSIDFRSRVMRGTGSLVHYQGNNQLEFSAGASQSDGVGQTNVGRNQLRGWGYNFAQARYATPRLFFNAYRAQSTSGESFAINRYADAWARNPNLSPDSLRMLSDWPSDGRLYAAEFQNNFRLLPLLNTQFVWGAQYRQDVVSSKRQWLTDRLTGEDLSIRQMGIYGQSETPLMPWLDVVLAARVDDHESYDTQFSPKAGLVFKPADNQALRVTYNRAFKSPTTLQTSFHIPDWTAVISIFGNTGGYRVFNNAAGTGTPVATYEPLRPEENTTWEVGYKGVLGNRIFLDVTGYRSQYQGFMSPLAIISNPYAVVNGQAAPTFAFTADGRPVDNSKLVLTYFNLGEATLQGVDAGINFFLSPKVTLNGTVSLIDLESVDVPAGREEATALNAPKRKMTLGATFREIGNFQGGLALRHVTDYHFQSGINTGVIPAFTTTDLTVGYRIRPMNTTMTLGVNNLLGCSQRLDAEGIGYRYAPTDARRLSPINKDRHCGFNVRHQEMINMPAIGTMVFLGARYHIQ